MGDHNAGRSCCAARCPDGGYCSLPERHNGECYSDKESLLDFKYPARHELAAKDAEIARLKAEVERLTSDGYVPMLQAEIARLERALAAGPAAVRRQENVDVNTREAYARVVEVAQADAMKEKP